MPATALVEIPFSLNQSHNFFLPLLELQPRQHRAIFFSETFLSLLSMCSQVAFCGSLSFPKLIFAPQYTHFLSRSITLWARSFGMRQYFALLRSRSKPGCLRRLSMDLYSTQLACGLSSAAARAGTTMTCPAHRWHLVSPSKRTGEIRERPPVRLAQTSAKAPT